MNLQAAPPVLAWMSALADPTRLRALRLVERHEFTVAELCAILQLPQSTVSRHLKVLGDEGWVVARPEATSRLYRMNLDGLEPAARRLWGLLREQAALLPTSTQDDRRVAGVLERRQTPSQAFFSSAAGQWDRMRREMFGDRFDAAGLLALLDPDWVVGDLGCGTGQVAALLAPVVRRVVAVESSRAMLRTARQRLADAGNVDLRSGELQALPIENGTLDAAVACLVLHHVPDPPQVLREACRALRPGGRLLVVDMLRHDRSEYRQQMGHVWPGFEPARIEAWFEEAGLRRPRILALPPAPEAKGPALFAAVATPAPRHRVPTSSKPSNGSRNSERRRK